MASNPMQRKARNSFLLGVFLTLLLAAAVVGVLLMQLKNYREKEAEELSKKVSIYVVKQDVQSGQIITSSMLEKKEVNRETVPNNAIDPDKMYSFSLTDKAGNEVTTEFKDNEPIFYLKKDGQNKELKFDDTTENYYIEVDGGKEYIQLAESPVVAKVNINKNAYITLDMIAKSDEKTTNDLRKQEYNLFILPSQLETKEYVDIRMALPTGEDYIVLSKKQVEIPEIGEEIPDDTIIMNMTESETLIINNAIVDAYKIEGAKLYAARYVEAGMQDAAEPTYVPRPLVMKLIDTDPNIVDTAKIALKNRYARDIKEYDGANPSAGGTNARNTIQSAIDENAEAGEASLNAKIQESITKTKENRKKYLESLMAGSVQ